MKIYFGKVEQDAYDFDPRGWYMHEGKPYAYVLDFEQNEGGVVIKDTCDRYIPMELQDLQGLLNAVVVAEHYATPAVAGLRAAEVLFDRNEVRSV